MTAAARTSAACRRPRAVFRVKCVRDGTAAHLTVRNETGKAVLVRIPAWAPEPSLRLFANDKPLEIAVREGFALIPGGVSTTKIELHYALPEYTTEETWRDEFATQESVTFRWRGDQICEVDQVGRYLAPFPEECNSFLDQN